ncbi:DNA-binding transcriptional LysR family regulator [Virgibacillus halotolerans]|uniref:LysR family transcriptional regulator n=1 Tax=Virgibacillus halotolerans TaxID=1071053 RepID=UPI001961ECD0|nr:LysR family transcriptional regulator [Virgibacillus halotolerans]MBM7599056.1 DNA-binding transcriptional LysR family regulator [Virgibacillus halotolerans]
MNHNQIEAFLTTIRLGSLSKAANYLYVSQSTISQRLHSIEEEYGLVLLNRDRGVKGISLTNEGERFYQIALEYESLLFEAKNVKKRSGEITITIGAVDSVHNYIFKNMYKIITQEIPNIRLAIRTYQSNEIYSLIEQRKIDIGLSLQERVLRNISVKQLFSEQMVLIKDRKRKQQKGVITNDKLPAENQLYINWGKEYQIWHEKHWGSPTNTYIQIDTAKMLHDLLIDSNLWAIVPVSIARNFYEKDLVDIFIPKDPPPNRVCYLVEKEGFNKYSQEVNDIFSRSMPKIEEIVRPWED